AVPYAPQLELLRRASLCITHAGLNTVMECLRFAVPMVCIPITNDQPAVAARVRWTRAGEVVPVRKLSSVTLRAEVERVLNNAEYRRAACSLASAVQKAGGVERGADVISKVLNTAQRSPGLEKGATA
ncbi:MAG: glycosyl transferase, partial [Acidobacteriaceae bacterium]|nr:glycosyl transferase [Acidobacteriaceae bacterium]